MSHNEVEVEDTCWRTISFLQMFVLAAIGYRFFGPFQTPLIDKVVTAAAVIKKVVPVTQVVLYEELL